MNFETKYLIRWGIPGWYLLGWVGFLIYQNDPWQIRSFLATNNNILALITIFTTLFVIFGVLLGYLLHQYYFFYVLDIK
ncbi:hypothetical protein [Bacillus alveayuensis]|uniref:hypothetical protein n=1 Tax=Aeribacillus alveayuensis TaxID=279215 RepID=UPI0005D0EA98|nr:hypothetical protein [Bacillus alveayuensis]